MGMNFAEALKVMKQGGKVKLPSWGGYLLSSKLNTASSVTLKQVFYSA